MSQVSYLDRGGNRQQASPAQMQQEMQKWMTWLKELTEKGHVKDPGHPLERSGKLVTGTSRTVTDGPFAESKELVSGYTILKVGSKQEAIDFATRYAELLGDIEVDVRQVAEH